MNYESIRLGKIKKKLLTALELGEDDPNIYVLPSDLDALASAHPEDYLSLLEEWRVVLSDPAFVAREGNKAELYRFVKENGRFRVRTLLLERHEKWICKGFAKGSLVAVAKRLESV